MFSRITLMFRKFTYYSVVKGPKFKLKIDKQANDLTVDMLQKYKYF